jgi:hypothetical protein
MDTSPHTLKTLFEQLGLPSDDNGIERFIKEHKPLQNEVPLTDATWWNPSQKRFLAEALETDSDWAIPVDELNSLLRSK